MKILKLIGRPGRSKKWVVMFNDANSMAAVLDMCKKLYARMKLSKRKPSP